jgi:hypothetical protein
MLEDVTVGNVQRARVRRAGEEATKISETAYDPLRQRMEERGNLMYITSPVGRVIPTTDTSRIPLASAEEAVVSNVPTGLIPKGEQRSGVDRYMNDLFSKAQLAVSGDPEVMGPVKQFLETKLVPWIKNQASTVSDPVREALITGKLKLPKGSQEERQIPQAMINAAREGDPTAMYWIEDQYDKMVGKIKGYRSPTEQEAASATKRYEGIAEEHENMSRLILDQMKTTPEIMPDTLIARLMGKDVQKMKPEELKAFAQNVRQKIKDSEGGWFTDVLEPKLLDTIIPKGAYGHSDLMAIQEPQTPTKQPMLGTPEGIAALARNQPILHDVHYFGSSGPKPLGLYEGEISEALTQIPPQSLKNMGMSEFFTNVFRLREKKDLVENAAKQAVKLTKEGKPVPIEVSGMGTTEFLPKDAQGFQWREITDPNAAVIHGKVMSNSIASYAKPGTYGEYQTGSKALKEGKVKLFALYDPNNHIITNVEYAVPDNKIAQMFGNGPGTGNAQPVDYFPQMRQLIEHIKPQTLPNGLKNTPIYSYAKEVQDMKRPQYLNLVDPEGRKHGGLVERNTNDDRRYL